MDIEEITRIMREKANKDIAIPKTHNPDMPHRVLTQTEEKLPEPKETTNSIAIVMKEIKSPLATMNDHELLVYIARQSARTNELLTQIRNLYINRPLDWKSPEEEVQNGEIS